MGNIFFVFYLANVLILLSALLLAAPGGLLRVARDPSPLSLVVYSLVNNFGKVRVYATGQEILELSLKEKHAAAKLYDGNPGVWGPMTTPANR